MSATVPNSVLTPSVFAKLVLMDLGGALNVCSNMSHSISPEFAQKNYKIGSTINVRKPYRFTVANTLVYAPQGLTDQVTPVTVSLIAQVGFEWDSVEKTLNIREARELYSRPAALALASNINAAAAQYVASNTWNATGTPGTTPTDEKPYLTAGDILCEQGLPEAEPVNLIINRKMSSAFVSAVKTLYNPTGVISKQWTQGTFQDSLGYSVFRDQTIYTRTTGPFGGTPLVDATGGVGTVTAAGGNNGTMNLPTKGWTAAAAPRLVVGDRFTIAGVYSVHPQTRQSTGRLQQFVVTANFSSTAAGGGNVAIAPAITVSPSQYQNVTAAPADGAAITVVGTASTAGIQGILMHRNAYAFVCVPLSDPDPGMGALVAKETDADTGITLSFVRAFDGVNRKEINRIDVLYGFGGLYKEMACCIES